MFFIRLQLGILRALKITETTNENIINIEKMLKECLGNALSLIETLMPLYSLRETLRALIFPYRAKRALQGSLKRPLREPGPVNPVHRQPARGA